MARRASAGLVPVVLSLAVGLWLPADARSPGNGETPTAKLPMNDAELKNLALVKTWWRLVVEAGHLEFVEQYQAETYIQHNPNISTGRAAFLDAFRGSEVLDPIPTELTEDIPLAGARGDFAWIMRSRRSPDTQRPGKSVYSYGFDLLRLDRGQIQEHWDGARKSASAVAIRFGRSIRPLRHYDTGSLSDAERHARDAAERAVVQVYVRRDEAAKSSRFAPDFVEHDPRLKDAGSLALHPGPGPAIQGPQPRLTLVNGSYVFMMWEAASPDPGDSTESYPWFFFHLVRMRDGKVAEHWGADQPP